MQPQKKPVPTAESINPATGKFIESYEYISTHERDAILADAAQGFIAWRDTPLTERVTIFKKMAAALRSNATAAAEMMTHEMGKPIKESRAEVEKCAALCEWYAEHGPAMLANEPANIDGAEAYVSYTPLGTVLGIMPWNFPFWQAMRAAVPILLGGNGFVMKHASNVMGCAYLLEKIWHQSGLPQGAFRVLNVSSKEMEPVIADDRIAAVTLTGSMGAGASVASIAGKHLKKTVLELGGSDPFIVLADADIEKAVEAGIKARFNNAGQVCIAAKRFILEKPIAEKFTELFVAKAKEIVMGDPMKDTTLLGPLARSDLRDDLHAQVQKTIAQGARLLLGGTIGKEAGCFYAPTILANVAPGMVAFEEETFGPVAALTTVANVEEALALANRSTYGLSGNLWSRDLDRAKQFARRMETGGVFINGFSGSDPRVPIGGVKQSGYGRELSHFGLHAFMNAQTVVIH